MRGRTEGGCEALAETGPEYSGQVQGHRGCAQRPHVSWWPPSWAAVNGIWTFRRTLNDMSDDTPISQARHPTLDAQPTGWGGPLRPRMAAHSASGTRSANWSMGHSPTSSNGTTGMRAE